MALVAVGVAYGVFRLLGAVLPRTRTGVLAAAGVGAFVSVPVAALAFVGLFAVGGVADVPVGTVAVAMGGVHLLIGIGEALITVAVLAAVLAVRPDLVWGARRLRTAPELATRPATPVGGAR
jgi:cobalt/nickel transport system permease protein